MCLCNFAVRFKAEIGDRPIEVGSFVKLEEFANVGVGHRESKFLMEILDCQLNNFQGKY